MAPAVSIVTIASTSGHVDTAMVGPYVSSKWGVRGLTQTAAIELARDRIRVNAISAGGINTPLITAALRPGEDPVSDHFFAKPFAVPRIRELDEVTRLILFLASGDSAFITGIDYVIDGECCSGRFHSVTTEMTQRAAIGWSERPVPALYPHRRDDA